MPKVKIPRKNISLDMTAMCDMAFLLLTFFILTTKFKPQEPVAVDIPSSTAKKVVPADSIMIISIDNKGAVFFGIDNQNKRRQLIGIVNEQYKLQLTETEMSRFSNIETFGIPLSQLKAFLNKPGSSMMEDHPGIPVDSTNNELFNWIGVAKKVNPKLRIAVKGDRMSEFKYAKAVIGTLQDLNLNHLSFITSLENEPKL